MANTAILQALAFIVLYVSVSFVTAIAKPEVGVITPLDSTKTNLNNGLAETKPEVASFTMMERMMKSLKEKAESPNGLSDFTPLLAKFMHGLTTEHDNRDIPFPMGNHNEKSQLSKSSHIDQGHLTSDLRTANTKPPKGRLTAQSSIADIMAHLIGIPNLGTPISSTGHTDQGHSESGHGHSETSKSFHDSASKSRSSSKASFVPDVHNTDDMKVMGMKLMLAKDLLKTSVTTLTAASSIIEKLITEAGESFTGNDHRPLGDHLFKSPGDNNKIIVEQKRSRKHKTETKTESHSSPSRKTGSSIVDNEQLTPFQSIFGEIVKAKSSLHENPMREKDFVKSGKNSLQPNSNDKERFSHPMDFPHQAEPYPHLKGSGKMPDMMQHPSPMNMMNSFAGSMLPQFESPVPLQHSMPMGPPNQGFGPGPNQQRFGSGTGPTLNRGFLPQGDPRNFMSG